MSRRGLFAAASVAVACAAEPPPVLIPIAAAPSAPSATEPPPEPPPKRPPNDYPGRYAVTGHVVEDECGGSVVLAAGNISVDVEAGLLHADVVDRDYKALVAGDRLIAQGDFPIEAGCPGTTVHEEWSLKLGKDGIEGELVSSWVLPPSCSGACSVMFAISARRIGP